MYARRAPHEAYFSADFVAAFAALSRWKTAAVLIHVDPMSVISLKALL
jgi:hypothetical protein